MKKKQKAKKKNHRNGKPDHDIERLKPLITINEPDECLFAIVDFSIPGRNHVRRIISKRTKSTGMVTVGPDNTCDRKWGVMEMKEAPPEKFWRAVNVLRDLYGIVGGISDVRCYEGRTMREAAQLMERFNQAKVWMLPIEGTNPPTNS